MNRRLLTSLVIVILFATFSANGQTIRDTSLNRDVADTALPRNAVVVVAGSSEGSPVDTLKAKNLPFQPNPKKSALYSAILPGSGQLYNRQYWKIPVIYAGVAASVYFLVDNSRQYQRYRHAYISRINNPTYEDEFSPLLRDQSNPTGLSPQQLQQNLLILQNQFKKQLDLTILLTTVGYTLQVLDALTFAHLKNFDVSKDISMRMQPVAMPGGDPGLGLVMRF